MPAVLAAVRVGGLASMLRKRQKSEAKEMTGVRKAFCRKRGLRCLRETGIRSFRSGRGGGGRRERRNEGREAG